MAEENKIVGRIAYIRVSLGSLVKW